MQNIEIPEMPIQLNKFLHQKYLSKNYWSQIAISPTINVDIYLFDIMIIYSQNNYG